jgi:predicted nucleotidyltransferase
MHSMAPHNTMAPVATHFVPDPALLRLVEHVVARLSPLEVWLFGSRAEGRARWGSDYDLLAVLPDDAPASLLDPIKTWEIASEAGVPADIVPCTLSEFDEEKHEIDSLPRAAFLGGKQLYERPA